MKINNVSSINFKSNVKVIDDFYGKPEDKLNKKDASTLKQALTKLQHNGEDDTVKVFALDGLEGTILGIKVEKEIDGKKYQGRIKIPLFFKDLQVKDIQYAYAIAVNEALEKTNPITKSKFDTFM